MGCLDLNAANAQPAPLDAFTGLAAKRGEAADFSTLEWTTILLARRDGVASLVRPGRIARFLGILFGIDPKSGLADERLEALRRFAIFCWQHGYNVPRSEFGAFRLAGYSVAQAETLLASVATARVDRYR